MIKRGSFGGNQSVGEAGCLANNANVYYPFLQSSLFGLIKAGNEEHLMKKNCSERAVEEIHK